MYLQSRYTRIIHLLLLLSIGLLLAACGDDDDGPLPTSPLAAPEQATETAVAAEPTEEIAEPTATQAATATTAPEPAEPEPTEDAATPTATADGGATEVDLELVVDGLASPVAFIPAPDGRHFIVDQVGLIYVLDEDGELLETPFLDLRDRMVELDDGFDERGLLGMALHPDFADNGLFYVYYSAPLRDEAPEDWNHTSHISEFQVSLDADAADPDSERILLQVDQPQFNHDGGQITFGPDGYLYIPLGDGGGANDTATGHVEDWYDFNGGGNGQDIEENLLGSILRIDVDNEGQNGEPYAIPEDNPFVDDEDVPGEIWAYGFRNPFRITFDMGGDDELFVGDAGQDRWEEVSIATAGGNYGWNVKEGAHCFDAANPGAELEECPDETADGDPLIDPVIEYQNGNQPGGIGLVVIGGYVYRGSALEDFEGRYIFGDWSTSFEEGHGKLFVANPAEDEGELWSFEQITIANSENGALNEFLLSFGQDLDGELYVLTTETPGPTGDTGKVYQIVPAGEAEPLDDEDDEDATAEATEAATAEATEQATATAEATAAATATVTGTATITATATVTVTATVTATATITPTEEAAETTEVSMENVAFVPLLILVEDGATVTWTNNDSVDHTVTAGTPEDLSELFDSGPLAPGETFTFTFEEPGTYVYFCTIHPGMVGSVVVQ